MITTFLVSFLVACGSSEPVAVAPPPAPVEAPAVPAQVTRAVELATAVRAQPTDVTAALTAKNGTAAELEGLLYDIAADPALTDAYTLAMRP